MKKIFFLISIIASSLLFSCSDKKDYDHKKAVTAFASINQLRIDEALQGVEIKIPPQYSASTTLQNLENKGSIENFAFKPLTTKKFLNKLESAWTGYRSGFADRFVFAPIILDKKIYLLDASGILASYGLDDGKKIWESRLFARKLLKTYQNPRIGYFDQKIFAIAGSNEIVAASAVDGKILWSKTILSLPNSAPISDGKFVYFTTNDNKTYALDALSGKLLWTSAGINKSTAIFGAASPIIYKNAILVCYSSGEIYALNRENGEALWSQDLNINKAGDSDFYLNDIDATPIVKNDIVYTVGNGGLMMAINAKNGNYIWKKEIASITDFWLAQDFLFIVNNEDKLIALQAKSGAVKWISQLPSFAKENKPETKIIYSGIVMAGDKLIIADTRGRLLVANPQDGKVEQDFKINYKIYHAPKIVDSKIYLHTLGRYTINLVEIW